MAIGERNVQGVNSTKLKRMSELFKTMIIALGRLGAGGPDQMKTERSETAVEVEGILIRESAHAGMRWVKAPHVWRLRWHHRRFWKWFTFQFPS